MLLRKNFGIPKYLLKTVQINNLVHLADEIVDVNFTITVVTTFDEVRSLTSTETTSGGVKLERPEDVVGFIESGTDGENFVDQIFHTDDVVLGESSFNDGVISEGSALLVDLSESTLVDQFADALQVGSTISDIRFNNTEHVEGGLGELKENTIVDLLQTEELQNLTGLGAKLVDTLDTDDENELGSFRDVERSLSAGNALQTDFFAFSIQVFLNVAFSTLEDFFSLLTSGNTGSFFSRDTSSTSLFDSLTLLQDVERNGRNGRFTTKTKIE